MWELLKDVYETLIVNQFSTEMICFALARRLVRRHNRLCCSYIFKRHWFCSDSTSLLSQVDSSIGAKTGVRGFLRLTRIWVGAFYIPKLVYMNLSTLNSLPESRTDWRYGRNNRTRFEKRWAWFLLRLRKIETKLFQEITKQLRKWFLWVVNIKRVVVWKWS